MDGTVPSSKKYLDVIVLSSKKLVYGAVPSCKNLVDGTVKVVNIDDILHNWHINLYICRSVKSGFVKFTIVIRQNGLLNQNILYTNSIQLNVGDFKGTVSLKFLLMHCMQPWPVITAR